MLYGNHLFTYGPANSTAGKNRFKISNNNETFNEDLDALGYGDLHDQFLSISDSMIDLNQSFSLPANSIGVLEIDLGVLISIEEATNSTLSVSVYPNPGNALISVDIDAALTQSVDICLLDSRGRKVQSHQQMLQAGINQTQLDVSPLPEGLYLLKINGRYGETMKKLLIQR